VQVADPHRACPRNVAQRATSAGKDLAMNHLVAPRGLARIALAIVTALALGTASLASSETVDPEDVAHVTAALTVAGCVVDEAGFDDFAQSTGFADDRLADVLTFLFASGRLLVEETTLRLVSEACPDGHAISVSDHLVAVIEALRVNGCAMTSLQADTLPPELGDPGETRAYVRDLMDAGLARVTRVQREALLLSEALCVAGPDELLVLASHIDQLAETPERQRPAFPVSSLGVVNLLVAELRDAHCVAADRRVLGMLEEMEVERSEHLLGELVGAGALAASGGFVALSEPFCTAPAEELPTLVAALLAGMEAH